ncbi:hypothetical protein JXL83_10165 [candidate division WOR-3 bacterium]|nr:hypothetical protein [candidate division WOR-3 bacterium]
MNIHKTQFTPQVHGFSFENRFKITTTDLGLGSFAKVSFCFGLCGGMCFAALDRFFKAKKTETRTDIPALPDPLFKEIVARQIGAAKNGVWWKVMLWQNYPATNLRNRMNDIEHRTKSEWPAIRKHLDNGVPITICLISTRGCKGNPKDNHLVVAYHYEEKDGRTFIQVYDPNHPKISQNLSANLKPENDNIDIVYSSTYLKPLRGFFPVVYDR